MDETEPAPGVPERRGARVAAERLGTRARGACFRLCPSAVGRRADGSGAGRPSFRRPCGGSRVLGSGPRIRTGYRPFGFATDVSCLLPLGQRDGKCGDPGAGALRPAPSEPPAPGAGPASQRPSRGRQFVRLRPPSRPRCGAFRVPAAAVRTLVTAFQRRGRCRHHGVALQPRTLSAAG